MTSTAASAQPEISLSTGGRHARDRLFVAFGLLSTLLGLVALGALLYDVISDGAGRLSWQFMTSYTSRRAADAGIYRGAHGQHVRHRVDGGHRRSARESRPPCTWRNTADAADCRVSSRSTSANLAGVPAIIYGLLGLGLFVRAMGMGQSVLAGASTLALLVLPGRDSRRRGKRCARFRARFVRARTPSARRNGRPCGIRCCRRRFLASSPASSCRCRGRSAKPLRSSRSAR